MIATLPDQVSKHQWVGLVGVWTSKCAKCISELNRANRAKQENTHTSGTMNFARRAEKEKKDGVSLTRAELYVLTHKRKSGNPVNEKAKEAIVQIKELDKEHSETSQNSTGNNIRWSVDDVYSSSWKR